MLRDQAKSATRRLLPAWLYRPLRRRRVARSVARYAPRVVSHSYGGLPLRVRIADPLAEAWYDHDWPALAELEILAREDLLDGGVVFDLGAHQAIVALMLAGMVGAEGQVVAVEAEPHNVQIARANRELNRAVNLEVLHAAVGARDGTLRFVESLNGNVEEGGGRLGKVEVPAVTVDTLAMRYGEPRVVLIDVEGFEGHVLAGAAKTLAGGRTAFLVEVHVGCGLDRPVAELANRFDERYRLLLSRAEHATTFVRYSPESPLVSDRFFLLALPPA